MGVTFACLDVSWLERIKASQLSDVEIDEVARHLEVCPTCAARMQALESNDPLAQAARSGGRQGNSELLPIVRELMRRVQDCSHVDTTTAGITPSQADGSPEMSLSALLAPARAPDEVGRLGAYRVIRILGKGGMGLVLEAEDTLLKRSVALKVIMPGLLEKPGARERFRREAQAAAALQSDHIVPIHQVGEERGVPFLAMPLLNGETLDSRLNRAGRMPLPQVLRLGREIALGLAVAHEHGLIHRDIKPSNIWLESTRLSKEDQQTERVKILDFGLARHADENTQLTGAGTILGTPAYMAPEQVESLPLDGRCDLFSLGCVLYQMSTGVLPFAGKTPLSIMRSLSAGTPASPRALNPEVPADLSDLILKLLSKNPAERPVSASLVSQQLADIELRLANSAMARRSPSLRLLAVAAGILVLLGCISYLFGGQIIRVATNKGDLVIDVSDPTIALRVVQNGVVVADKSTKREFMLSAGEGEIEVREKGGVKLVTKQFEIRRNDVTRLSVTFEELADARKLKSKEKTPSADSVLADRRAAAWVLSLGGTIRVSEGGPERAIGGGDPLPKGPFTLTLVDLQGNLKVTDKDLDHCKGCKNITRLRLGGIQLGDAALANFKDCKDLSHLDLSNNHKLTDAGLAPFGDCKDLANLELSGCKIGDDGLAVFKDSKNILQVNLQGTNVGDAGLAHLKHCKNLRVLDLARTQVGNAGIAHFAGFKEFVSINLSSNPKISDEGITPFTKAANMSRLLLHGTKVGDAGLVHLQNCKSLNDLGLSKTEVSDAGLRHLANLTKLQSLDVRGCKVSDEGVARLQTSLSKCKILWKENP